MEISIRFLAFRNKVNCMKDPLFVFDSGRVCMMIFETWIMAIILLSASSGEGGGGLGNAGLLRLLRLLRLSRMARVARLLRSMPELLVLIKGMIAAIRSVFFTLVLLFLILYVFAILFRQLTVDTAIGAEKFYNILSCMQTLVLDGILFDGPGDLMALIEDESLYVLVVVYYLFVLFAALTVMNMLIGVLCEVVSATAAMEREELTIVYVRERLQVICDRLCSHCYEKDEDGEQVMKVKKKEFLSILQDPEATQLLTEAQVDVFGLVDLIDTVFATETGAERVCDFGDLIEVFLDQRTSNTATVKDITTLRKYVRGRLDLMEKHTDDQMGAIGSMMEKYGGLGKGTFQYELQRRQKAHGINIGTADNEPVPPGAPEPRPEPQQKPATSSQPAAAKKPDPEDVPEEDRPEEEEIAATEDNQDGEGDGEGGDDDDAPGDNPTKKKKKKRAVKKVPKEKHELCMEAAEGTIEQ